MKNLIPHFIQEKYLKEEKQGSLQAYTMFIDLSGFTSLTENLMQEGNEGAEKLSYILNDIFSPMVARVYARGGFIPHFAGDAFTSIFPLNDKPDQLDEFLQLASSVLGLFDRRKGKISRYGPIKVGIKIGLSVGEVKWGILGKGPKTYYFTGQANDRCVQSALMAEGHDIMLDKTLHQKINNPAYEFESVRNDFYRISKSPEVKSKSYEKPQLPDLQKRVVRQFLPNDIIEFRQEGEFRNVISTFISFDGVTDHKELELFIDMVLKTVYNYKGYFKEIDFSDKGGLLVAIFGAPRTYENLENQALECILTIEEKILNSKLASKLKFRAGITLGLAFTGIIGGEERCQYAAAGNRVNLAARLAIHASWGNILVDEGLHKNRSFMFAYEGDIRYKGIKNKVPTYSLKGRNKDKQSFFQGKMVGRTKEMQKMLDFSLRQIKEKKGGVLRVFGEAGIGKSRLTYEFKNSLEKQTDVHWFSCVSDQILQKPFNTFLYFFRQFFKQSAEQKREHNQQNFEKIFNETIEMGKALDAPQSDALIQELQRTKPVFAARLGLDTKDSLWENLSAEGRLTNTFSAIQSFFLLHAMEKPLIIELEDAHWIDEFSQDIINQLARRATDLPIELLITARYREDGQPPEILWEDVLQETNLRKVEVNLTHLNATALKVYAEQCLNGKISSSLFNLLIQTTNGNPFYIEQILEYFAESNLLEFKNGEWVIKDEDIKVSFSIKAILMARIDRLSHLVKETVKAAAVIGKEFEVPVLSKVLQSQDFFKKTADKGDDEVIKQIQTAEREQIWRAINELRYIFRHSLLRETIYDMQLRNRLRELHKLIAEAIEHLYANNLDEKYADLAFHYEQADEQEKASKYLMKAAEFARNNFQNSQALSYYDKILNYIPEDALERRIKTLLRKANVLELIGHWSSCENTYQEAMKLALELDNDILIGRINNGLGYLYTLQGKYKQAEKRLNKAIGIFEQEDYSLGLAVANGNKGNVYFRTGQYEAAQDYFNISLKLSQRHDYISFFSQISANLGLTHMNLGNYEEGIRVLMGQLLLCTQINDRNGMATLHTNLGIVYFEKGDYDEALYHYEKGLDLSRELGNKMLTSIAIGCIGQVYERKGDFESAYENYNQDLDLCVELGDKQGVSIANGLLGGLYYEKGEWEDARTATQTSLELSRELSYKKGMAKAHTVLGKLDGRMENEKEAREHFTKAIELSRDIHNRFLEANALVHYINWLMKVEEDEEKWLPLFDVLCKISDELKNESLRFKVKLLSSDISRKQGNFLEAHGPLSSEREKTLNPEQEAEILYRLALLDPENEQLRQGAKKLYSMLLKNTPRFTYKSRLEKLNNMNS